MKIWLLTGNEINLVYRKGVDELRVGANMETHPPGPNLKIMLKILKPPVLASCQN